MNIFVLDYDVSKAARMPCNSHVIKQIVEYCQLLSTAHRVLDIETSDVLKATHINHPCAIWTRENKANYLWLHSLVTELAEEYTFRYGKVHLYGRNGLISDLLNVAPANIKDSSELTPFCKCMPDDCKESDPVTSYRNYYNMYKVHLLKYKKREFPAWIDRLYLQV